MESCKDPVSETTSEESPKRKKLKTSSVGLDHQDLYDTLKSPASEKEETPAATEQSSVDQLPAVRSKAYFFLLSVMTSLSVITRLYNIEIPSHVCWDETHFGKMGSWYIKREFFFDVHPPLGKMLIGFFGALTGYDGEFPFSKPGDEYGDTNYVGMRICCALLGAALVPLSYMCVWQLTNSLLSSVFASSLILLDLGTLTLSRHILLDPIMLFFIMMATFCQLKFLSYEKEPYSFFWWFWLVQTGSFLAFAIGVKFVGLFIILFVGFTTIKDLWRLLGDQKLSLVELMKHFMARALCLILLPSIVYMIIFAVHFKVLNRSGNGDGFFSSAFQSQLIGNRLYNISMPENIAFGSVITLKQRRTGGAYLHSHWHLYPEEHPPMQQQVTSYAHKDYNNLWKIKPAERELEENDPVQIVKSGDLVRLEHVTTRRMLHSHREPAPLSQRQFQVSCYGVNGSGDANDVWIVEVVGESPGTPIQTARSKLKFIHYYVRCALYSHDKKLPKWGWDQLEATCNPNIREAKAVWSVEEVNDERLPNASFEMYSPSFMEKIMESHAVMTQGNSGLKPKEGEITSRPWQWPIDFRGQVFSGKDHRIYLLGNPVIFWGCLAAMLLFFLYFIVDAIKLQRGVVQSKMWRDYTDKCFAACWWLMLGWALHYLPFWPMTRVLYFHHYFPAFLFSAMFTGVVLDHTITLLGSVVPENLTMVVYHTGIGLVLSVLGLSFYLFYPLTYGMFGPLAHQEDSMMKGLKWMSSWDI